MLQVDVHGCQRIVNDAGVRLPLYVVQNPPGESVLEAS